MTSLLALLAFTLCLPNVLPRPEPVANLQNHHPSSVGDHVRGGRLRQGRHGSHVSSRPLGVAKPRWQTPLVRSNKVGGKELLKPEEEKHGSHPSILLNQLDPAKQVIFLEKFSLLNPVQQAFAFNQFFSTAPDVQTFAINQFIELEADLLVRSVQAELDKVADANPDEIKHILDGAQPELKLDSAVVVKLPVGRVCRDQQWIDGWGVRTLHRDCETGVVYNININVSLNIGASTTGLPDVEDPVTISPGGGEGVPTTTGEDPSTVNPTTEIPPGVLCEETNETRECPDDWFTCPDGGGRCVPPCRWCDGTADCEGGGDERIPLQCDNPITEVFTEDPITECSGDGCVEEEDEDEGTSTMRSTTTMMTTTPSEDTQDVDDEGDVDSMTVVREVEIVPEDEGEEGSGESVEFGGESNAGREDNRAMLFQESSEFEENFGANNPAIVFQEEKIMLADEKGSQLGEFSSAVKAREPKSSLGRKEEYEKPSSASLLSSLLSSLYEEETRQKAEKSKSEEYVYVNHVSGSKQIYI